MTPTIAILVAGIRLGVRRGSHLNITILGTLLDLAVDLARSTTRSSLKGHVAVRDVLWFAVGHEEASVVAVLKREGKSLASMGAEELLSVLELYWEGTVRRRFRSRFSRRR